MNEGFFSDFDVVYTGAPYYIEIEDLNNDGLLDLIVQDDEIDRYLLNQGERPRRHGELLNTFVS